MAQDQILETTRDGTPVTLNAWMPEVTALPNGQFAVAGSRVPDASSLWQAFVQRLDDDGSLVGEALDVMWEPDVSQWYPTLAALPDGTIYVAFERSPVDVDEQILHTRFAPGADTPEPDPPVAALSNYALHYVGGTGAGHVSADYFGMVAECLAEGLDARSQDPPFVGMLTNGASGDINNINFRLPRKRQAPYEQMRRVADAVAGAALRIVPAMAWREDVRLEMPFRAKVDNIPFDHQTAVGESERVDVRAAVRAYTALLHAQERVTVGLGKESDSALIQDVLAFLLPAM